MSNNKKKIFIVTQHYPYGTSERSFLEPEIKYLLSSQKFDITIISNHQQEEKMTGNVDDRIEVISIPATKIFQKPLTLIKYFFKYWFDRKCQQERIEIIAGKEKRLGRIIKSIMCYIRANIFWKQVEEKDIKLDNSIIYTYWFHIQTLAFALNRSKIRKCKLVSRIHRFDLYDESVAFGRQPFHSFMDNEIDKLYFIAEAGMNYYINKIGASNRDKYQLCRLGTLSIPIVEKRVNHKEFILVSCSSLIPLKRVNMIIEGLAEVENVDVKWIHFGEGTSRKELEELANNKLKYKKNIEYEFMGQKNNKEIMNFYAENKVDCFITASESEGCPVSIQEVMSFGIPIIATAVGEIPLMIDGNGILLDENLRAKDVTNAINKFREYNPEEILKMGEQSRKLWEKYFDGERNFTAFVTELTSLYK